MAANDYTRTVNITPLSTAYSWDTPPSWITITQVGSSNDWTITLASNSGAARNATLTVRHANTTTIDTITVSQLGGVVANPTATPVPPTPTPTSGSGAGPTATPVQPTATPYVSGGGGGGGCHVAGELITLADGQTKLVEDILIGDILLSIDFEGLNISGEYNDWKKTEETLVSEYTSTVVTNVTILDFFRYFNINAGLLKITEEHPVLIKDNLGDIYFKQVKDIVVNDSLLNENNVWIKIDSVELVTVPEKFTTYALDVEESDVYFANNIVVHNVESFEKEETL